MLKKPNGYDEVIVNDGDFIPLELGGHRCIIMSAEEYQNPSTNKESIKLYLDTDKDDIQPQYYTDAYKKDTRPNKAWDTGAIVYLPLGDDENQVKILKGGITAIENSNNFTFDWKDVNTLKNKKVGCVFGLEEYESNDGKIKTKVKARRLRSLDKIDEVQIPNVKTLNNGYVSYDDYMENKDTYSSSQTTNTVQEIDEDSLPF